MNEVLKYLGATLRRYYGVVVQRPIPWRMIDRLESLEERCERAAGDGDGAAPRPDGGAGEARGLSGSVSERPRR